MKLSLKILILGIILVVIGTSSIFTNQVMGITIASLGVITMMFAIHYQSYNE